MPDYEKCVGYYKQYRQDNKEKYRDLQSQKSMCSLCGSVVRKYGMKEHQQTKKCKRLAKQQTKQVDSS